MTISLKISTTLRQAQHEDAADVAILGSHVYALTFGHSLPIKDLETYLDEAYSITAVAEDIADPNKSMIVATGLEGAIIGFALLTRGASEPCIGDLESKIELQRIYVHPSYQGKKIGNLLANRLEDMAREQGFKHIWLGGWEENYKAQRVYEKLGYRMVGWRSRFLHGRRYTNELYYGEATVSGTPLLPYEYQILHVHCRSIRLSQQPLR